MKTIAHTYETERICKFQVGIMENNGKLKQIEGLEPKEYKEEIIRCRDCKNVEVLEKEIYDYFGALLDTAEFYYCSHFRGRWNDGYYEVNPEGFCAWAEKVD